MRSFFFQKGIGRGRREGRTARVEVMAGRYSCNTCYDTFELPIHTVYQLGFSLRAYLDIGLDWLEEEEVSLL